MARPFHAALGALLLAVFLVGCRKTPEQRVDKECSKRYKHPSTAEQVPLAQSCLDTYRREMFGRNPQFSPLTRGPDNSAAAETTHFSTVLGHVHEVCSSTEAKVSYEPECKRLCATVAAARAVYPHFLVDGDEGRFPGTSLRDLCADDFGVVIPPEPARPTRGNRTSLAE